MTSLNIDNIWKYDTYINTDNAFLFNREIIEYDMKDAGFSIIKENKLLSDKTINQLSLMDKNARRIKIGKLQNIEKGLKESLKTGFETARELFFLENSLTSDDIVSIKKDAIFTTKRCKKCKIGKFIEFRPKNFYTSYLNFNKTLEIYYSIDKLDIKGIGDEKIVLHENYMVAFLKDFFNKVESTDNKNVILFMKRFIDKYKTKKLDIGYYREMNSMSLFTINSTGDKYEYYDDIDDIDISYNYYNILIKMLKMLL